MSKLEKQIKFRQYHDKKGFVREHRNKVARDALLRSMARLENREFIEELRRMA